jgi:hypothetical protein
LSVIVKQVSRFSVELSVKEFGDFFLLSNQVRFFHPIKIKVPRKILAI